MRYTMNNAILVVVERFDMFDKISIVEHDQYAFEVPWFDQRAQLFVYYLQYVIMMHGMFKMVGDMLYLFFLSRVVHQVLHEEERLDLCKLFVKYNK